VEEWKDGRMEGWKSGRVEGWKGGRMEGWKGGRVEGWKDGRMEGWKGVHKRRKRALALFTSNSPLFFSEARMHRS
jgi:hypothetical protein